MRIVYGFCFFVFALFYLPAFLLKGKHKSGLGARFGFVPDAARGALKGRQVVWVHGVSVGEVVQAFRFIEALKQRVPSMVFVVTTTTAAGGELALKLKSEKDQVLYFPVDFSFSVRRFLDGIRPYAVVFVETEIWPNLLSELSRRKIPAFIVNGRISDKAAAKYRKVRFFMAPLLNCLRAIGAQDELMKRRFVELGADPRNVFVTGSMKFDSRPVPGGGDIVKAVEEQVQADGSFLCIAGSTHEGEEAAVLDVYKSIRSKHPRFRLLIAPRHLERLESVARLASKKGVCVCRTSQARRAGASAPPDGDFAGVFLLDSMGLLAGFFRIADAVFVGGSLVPAGGHNLAEPAYFEKPVLFGPYMSNFRSMAEAFKKSGAGIEVRNAGELEARLLELVEDREKGVRCGQNARRLVLSHQGATQKNAELFLEALKE